MPALDVVKDVQLKQKVDGIKKPKSACFLYNKLCTGRL